MTATLTRTCPICGSVFAPNPNEKLCSDVCKARAKVIANQNRLPRGKAPATKTCDWCGEPFETTRSLQRFCSEPCQRRTRLDLTAPERTCKQCGGTYRPRSSEQMYCDATCRNADNRATVSPAQRYRIERSDIAIAPTEQRPVRTKPMTDEEMRDFLAVIRVQLNAGPQLPGDRWWRRTEDE